jgi:glycosyltransferase involved in cell wall biosynthesis
MCSPSVRTPCIPSGRPRDVPGGSSLVRSHIERAWASFSRLRAGRGTGVSSSSSSGRLWLSIEDAFGLVTVEAMASGLPPIVSDHVRASELISSGKDELVTRAGDASALAEAMELVLDDEDRRRDMGLAARARVERGCSWAEYGNGAIAPWTSG